MQITNYQKKNWEHCNDCIVRGHIKMTHEEWELCRNIIIIKKEVSEMICDTYKRDSLPTEIDLDDIEKSSEPFCIGISGTNEIVKLFQLKRYKMQNYQIILTI